MHTNDDTNFRKFRPKLFITKVSITNFWSFQLDARLRGRTAEQRSKKGSENVLERVLGKGSQKASEKGVCYGIYSEKRFLRRVLRRGSLRRAPYPGRGYFP